LSIVLLIPAYRPGPELLEVLDAIPADVFEAVVIVDDGSGAGYRDRFPARRATVLRHERNRGKGAALRTGIAHILSAHPGCGVVTADADGQHHPADIVRVAQRAESEPESLVLGARTFDRAVPGRSRVGNRMARLTFRMLMGQNLQDTQTGLRGIPHRLLASLAPMTSNGYEFEIDMLTAAKHLAVPLVEEPVRTIYQPGNPTSHFHPLADSMRIGFVLARFTMLSLATAMLDNLIFSLAIRGGMEAAGSQVLARAAAVLMNYPLARRAVFLSRETHRTTLPRYLALVIASGFLSYQLLRFFERSLGWDVLSAKILAESALFLGNFIIQRDWVFVRRAAPVGAAAATDWDGYYRRPAPTAHWTRRYTASVLVRCLRQFGGRLEQLIELGGANSCFLNPIRNQLAPREYHVIDTIAYGLSLLRGRGVETHQRDCRAPALDLQADAVFSVGLVEHFDPENTREAIESHFALLKPGGCAIISFPTPTWLYRIARAITEAVGAWRFPDERPLEREEVIAAARPFAAVEFEKLLWPIVFTQRLIVFRKRA
jgi:glycosyltransferase involved in cell wall biosynthesis